MIVFVDSSADEVGSVSHLIITIHMDSKRHITRIPLFSKADEGDFHGSIVERFKETISDHDIHPLSIILR